MFEKNIQWNQLPQVDARCPECEHQLYEQPTRYGSVLYCKCGYEWYDGDGGRVKRSMAKEIAAHAATGDQPIYGGGRFWWACIALGMGALVMATVGALLGPYGRSQAGVLVANGLFMLVLGVWSLYRTGELEIGALASN